MSYVCYHSKNFMFIDSSVRNGVFCRFFPPSGKSKPLLLQSTPTTHYSATIAGDGKPEIVVMPNATHIYYYTYTGSSFNKTLLLTSETSTSLIHPMLYTQNGISQLIYLMQVAPHYQLMHQAIGEGTSKALAAFNQCPNQIKYMTTPTALYFFYLLKEDYYSLNCIKIEATGVSTFCYLRSEKPIIDYSICLRAGEVHVCYVLENLGKYQLYYMNPSTLQINFLTSSATPMAPAIFYYYHGLWINTLIDHQLHLLLSVNSGESFSIPVPCSIQTHLQRTFFVSTPLKNLAASELYVSLDTKLKLCTLSTIDFEGFHEYSSMPVELELLLEGLALHRCKKENCEIIAESNRLKQELGMLKKQTPSSSTKKQTNISSAKTAFMEELTSWDLPPRL
ncbi:hypothetical protein QTL86_11385 [Cellulosilyticum sp. ST5]|uniref:hypothetical protein n=1 Tax=Cellulosilyticum sp. ST5 TaxID=3055805 RepID=UPI0039779EAC